MCVCSKRRGSDACVHMPWASLPSPIDVTASWHVCTRARSQLRIAALRKRDHGKVFIFISLASVGDLYFLGGLSKVKFLL